MRSRFLTFTFVICLSTVVHCTSRSHDHRRLSTSPPCSAGELVNASNKCEACPGGTYQPLTDHNSASCTPWSLCRPTEWETTAPTATTNRVCQAHTTCGATGYETIPPTATSDRVCAAHTPCGGGQVEVAAPTATSDRVCGLAPPPTAAPTPSPTPTGYQDCVVSTLGPLSPCSATCGAGTQNRARSIVTSPAHGGTACPALVVS